MKSTVPMDEVLEILDEAVNSLSLANLDEAPTVLALERIRTEVLKLTGASILSSHSLRSLHTKIGDRCRGCRRPILWGLNSETGKRVPLDPRAPVYLLRHVDTDDHDRPVIALTRAHNAAVSHFTNCPRANSFSGAHK